MERYSISLRTSKTIFQFSNFSYFIYSLTVGVYTVLDSPCGLFSQEAENFELDFEFEYMFVVAVDNHRQNILCCSMS